MTLTEDEAKTKACHRSIVTEGWVISGMTQTLPVIHGFCIASECMAWREAEPRILSDGDEEGPILAGECNPPFSNMPEGFEVTSYNQSWWRASKNQRVVKAGYCGLAGSP